MVTGERRAVSRESQRTAKVSARAGSGWVERLSSLPFRKMRGERGRGDTGEGDSDSEDSGDSEGAGKRVSVGAVTCREREVGRGTETGRVAVAPARERVMRAWPVSREKIWPLLGLIYTAEGLLDDQRAVARRAALRGRPAVSGVSVADRRRDVGGLIGSCLRRNDE
jgi:hypothetical protein